MKEIEKHDPQEIAEMGAEEIADLISTLQKTAEERDQQLENMRAAFDASVQKRKQLEERVDRIEGRLEDVERQADMANAAVPQQSRQKIDNVLDALEYAYDHGSGGYAGKAVTTGEVTAAIDGSRSTARRLMDDVAGRFDWADVETPGGPNPKRLKLAIDGTDWETIQDAVVDEYGDRS